MKKRAITLVAVCLAMSTLSAQSQQNLIQKPQHTGKAWYVVAGSMFVAGAVCSLVQKSYQEPNVYNYQNYGVYKTDLTAYQQKMSTDLCNVSAGVCLIIGVTIPIKSRK